MRERRFRWLGHEFLALECDGTDGTAIEQAGAILDHLAARLQHHDLSLADTVRTRLWARDRASRDEASGVRFRVLAGAARSASSSYIDPQRFSSDLQLVSFDLLAMWPPADGDRRAVEHDPPRAPLRYLAYGPFRFLSGVTSPDGDLDAQVRDILPRIGEALDHAGSSWDRVLRVTAFLHRGQDLHRLRELLEPRIDGERLVIGFAEGFSLPGKLVEIEVTARTHARQEGDAAQA